MLSSLTLPSIDSCSALNLAEPISLIQSLINQVTEAVLCVDVKGAYHYINDAACSLLGYPREKLLEMNIDEIELDFLPSTWSRCWELIQEKSTFTFKTLRASQKEEFLEVTIKSLEHGSESLGCILAHPFSTNIPEKVREQSLALEEENDSFMSEAKSEKITDFYPSCLQFKPIFEIIEQNYHQPLSLNDVAQAVGYSPAYLTHFVKRRTQRTIQNWILERRMLEARSLLINTNKSVAEIAMAVGFTDAYYFSRRFSQSHKLSHRNWRQQHQQ